MNVIDKISKIREQNNRQWMALLRLAFELDPKRAGRILRQITKNDKKISRLMGRLKSGA